MTTGLEPPFIKDTERTVILCEKRDESTRKKRSLKAHRSRCRGEAPLTALIAIIILIVLLIILKRQQKPQPPFFILHIFLTPDLMKFESSSINQAPSNYLTSCHQESAPEHTSPTLIHSIPLVSRILLLLRYITQRYSEQSTTSTTTLSHGCQITSPLSLKDDKCARLYNSLTISCTAVVPVANGCYKIIDGRALSLFSDLLRHKIRLERTKGERTFMN
jgi:hypothetical protein